MEQIIFVTLKFEKPEDLGPVRHLEELSDKKRTGTPKTCSNIETSNKS